MVKENGKILPFPGTNKNSEIDLSKIDPESMHEHELIALKAELTKTYNELQEIEFDDPESPECFKWLSRISEIEDILDEIDDILEH